MNSINITGRLVRDPELRDIAGGEKVCSMRLAVDGMGRGGPDAAGYIDVSVFGASGQAAARTLTQGWLVAASGRLEYREWTQDDVKRSGYGVIGRVDFLAAPRPSEDGEPVAPAVGEEDIPF